MNVLTTGKDYIGVYDTVSMKMFIYPVDTQWSIIQMIRLLESRFL